MMEELELYGYLIASIISIIVVILIVGGIIYGIYNWIKEQFSYSGPKETPEERRRRKEANENMKKWLARSERMYSSTYSDYPVNWGEVRQQVLKKDNFRCGNCGSTRNLMVHHIVPLSKGGTNNLSNLRTLCEDCHKKLHPHMRN